MTVLLAVAAVFLSGAAVTRALSRGALRIALALLLGLGIWSAAYAAALFTFGADPRVLAGKDLLLAAGGLAFLAVARRAPGPAGRDEPAASGERWLAWAAAAAAVLATLFFLEHTLRHPDGGWDAWMIWNLRARFLARAGNGFADAFSPGMLFWAHQDYPLLLPGVVAQGFLLAGAQPLWVPAATAWAFAALDAALLAAAVSALRGVGWGGLGALALLSTPCFVGFAANQQSDVLVGAFLLAACVLVAVALERSEPRALALAGLAASLAAWSKNEGALYFLCLAAALVATRWGPLPQRLGGLVRFFLGALPVLALLLYFKLRVAHVNDLLHAGSPEQLLDLARWGALALAVVRRIFFFQDWALWLVAELAVLALVLPRLPARPAARVAGTAVALALAATMPVYVLQPHPLVWFVRASIDRVLIQLWPSVLLATLLALAEPAPRPAPATAHT